MNEEETPQEEEQIQEETAQEEVETTSCVKCVEYLGGWKRALADYDNLQKDLTRQRSELRTRAKEDVGYQIIAVLDNFDQAAKFQPEGLPKEVETWLMGLMHVRNQLESVMQDLGLMAYGAVGETFDAHLHDAGGERTEEDKEDQEILDIAQRGWKMGEKIVRPAKVIINNKK